jgi:hypothetical protein
MGQIIFRGGTILTVDGDSRSSTEISPSATA